MSLPLSLPHLLHCHSKPINKDLNLKSLKSIFRLCIALQRICVKMHLNESKFFMGPETVFCLQACANALFSPEILQAVAATGLNSIDFQLSWWPLPAVSRFSAGCTSGLSSQTDQPARGARTSRCFSAACLGWSFLAVMCLHTLSAAVLPPSGLSGAVFFSTVAVSVAVTVDLQIQVHGSNSPSGDWLYVFPLI